MTTQDLVLYTGFGTNAGLIENNFWQIDAFNRHYSSPFYKYTAEKTILSL